MVIEKDNVSRWLPTERRPFLTHCLHNILVTYLGLVKLYAQLTQGMIKAKVGHHRTYYHMLGRGIDHRQSLGTDCQDVIAIKNITSMIDGNQAICITIKGKTDVQALIKLLNDKGALKLNLEDEIIAGALLTTDGSVRHAPTAEAVKALG